MSSLQADNPDWQIARLGKLTASRYGDAMAKTRLGWGAGRERYLSELVCERMTGVPYPHFMSQDMKWGQEKEVDAKQAYMFLRDVDIVEVGFIPHPTIEMSGASPDGLIGDKGLIEIKCPASHTHKNWLLGQAPIPLEYIQQVQWQLICTGREWCDFVSFDPRWPFELQLLIRRIIRLDNKHVLEMEDDALKFLDEVELAHEQLQMLRDHREAA